jgi:hypothetical protein
MKVAKGWFMIFLRGVDVVQVVVVEPSINLFEQLGGGLQVHLSGTDAYMPHIGG